MDRKDKPARGLQGSDKRQSALRDPHGGAYGAARSRDHGKDDLPEGLERERKDPLGPSRGRRVSSRS